MIEYAFEVGLNQLELMDYGDYYFLLAHLFEDPRYREFVYERADRQRVWILDNSAFELGGSVDLDWLLSIAWDLPRLDVLVVPDKLGSKRETIRLCKHFVSDPRVKDLISSRQPHLMVVAQSEAGTVDELMSCLYLQAQLIRYELRYPYSKIVFGLPRKYATEPRLECAKRLSQLRFVSWIHFLGCPSIEDFKAIKGLVQQLRPIRFTLDTSLPWRTACGLDKMDFESQCSESSFTEVLRCLR